MTGHLAWYVARAGGIVAWLLVTASVTFGLLLSTRLGSRFAKAVWLQEVHRFVSLLAVTFMAVHVGALIADNYVHFGLADVLVPFASAWRPLAVALGVVAMWLVVAVEVTSQLKSHLPRRVWHAIHLSSYLAYWLVTVHLLAAGSDAWTRPVAALTIVTTAGLTALSLAGLARSARPRRRVVGTPDRRRPAGTRETVRPGAYGSP